MRLHCRKRISIDASESLNMRFFGLSCIFRSEDISLHEKWQRNMIFEIPYIHEWAKNMNYSILKHLESYILNSPHLRTIFRATHKNYLPCLLLCERTRNIHRRFTLLPHRDFHFPDHGIRPKKFLRQFSSPDHQRHHSFHAGKTCTQTLPAHMLGNLHMPKLRA